MPVAFIGLGSVQSMNCVTPDPHITVLGFPLGYNTNHVHVIADHQSLVYVHVRSAVVVAILDTDVVHTHIIGAVAGFAVVKQSSVP